MPAAAFGLPPLIDLGKDVRLRLPAINRQAEGRFSDEGIAAHGFERRASAVGFDLVVARGDPDFAAMFQTHLCRAEDMAGGVKTQGDAMVGQGLTVRQGLQVDVLAQSRTQNPFAGGGRQVMLVAGAGMVAVSVGDD